MTVCWVYLAVSGMHASVFVVCTRMCNVLFVVMSPPAGCESERAQINICLLQDVTSTTLHVTQHTG